MGFKTKIILVVILAALIGYVWYFHVPLNQDAIIFLVFAVIGFFVDFDIDNQVIRRKVFFRKMISLVLLAGLIFYVWYFKIPLDQNTIAITLGAGLLLFIGILLGKSAELERERVMRGRYPFS